MHRRPQKRSAKRPTHLARPDPLVAPGDPPYRHPPRTAPHPTRSHYRMVALETGASGFSKGSPHPKENATVMLGFDWVLIDCEHGTIGLETVELMVMAAEASGATPIVRPRSRDAQDI